MKLRKTVTFNDLYKRRYDLGGIKFRVVKVQVWGTGDPDELNDYFPPLVSSLGRLELAGKFKVVSVARLGRQNWFQLEADGENTPVATALEIDLDSQEIFDHVASMQVIIESI